MLSTWTPHILISLGKEIIPNLFGNVLNGKFQNQIHSTQKSQYIFIKNKDKDNLFFMFLLFLEVSK